MTGVCVTSRNSTYSGNTSTESGEAGLVTAPEEYPYSSAHSWLVLYEVPQRLKPVILTA